MAYRRANEIGPGTSRWRTQHRSSLAHWLPEAVLASDRSLNYVLLHGDDELGTGWSVAWLSPEEAGRFLTYLRAHLPESAGYDLIAILERRASQESSP